MDFKPFGDRLLVKVEEEEKTTSGGFIIPTKDKGDVISAEVIDVGDDIDLDLIGKKVYYKENSGEAKINLDGEDFYILDTEKVLGYI